MQNTMLENECIGDMLNGILNQTITTMVTYVESTALLYSNFRVAMIYLVILSVSLLVGTFGNVMILIIASCYRGINTTGKAFIVNLALADLCVAAIADPMCVIGVVKGKHFFDDMPLMCDLVASMCLTACFCAFMSLMMLSLNRFIYVCHNKIFDKIYGRKMNIFLCVICWVAAFLSEFPNFVGWGGHFYDDKSHQCIWDRTASYSYSLFVAIGLIGFPLVVMSVCYVLIFRYIWETKWNIFNLKKDEPQNTKKAWIEVVRASRMLFVIFVVYLVCWTPYAILIIVDFENKMSTEVHLFVTLLAHLHSSSNCVIFVVCNREFRKSVLALCCECCSLFPKESATRSSTQSRQTLSRSHHTEGETYLSSGKTTPRLLDLKANTLLEKQRAYISDRLKVYTTD